MVLTAGVVGASVAVAYGLGTLFDREGARPLAGPSPTPIGGTCDGALWFGPTHLPEGFSEVPVPGPAPGAPPAEPGQSVVHYTDGRGRAVEIRRPGTLFVELALSEDAPVITVLGAKTADFGPTEPRGDAYIVQFVYRPPGEFIRRGCELYSLNEYGLKLDELLKIAEGLEIRRGAEDAELDALLREEYRRLQRIERRLKREVEPPVAGAFGSCPDAEGLLRPGPDARSEARDVAIAFAGAEVAGDDAEVADLADPAWFLGRYGVCCEGSNLSTDGSAPAERSGIVGLSCGEDVEARSWQVTIDDGSSSASLDTELYLIRREDGWKVWGSY